MDAVTTQPPCATNDNREPWPDARPDGGFFALAQEIASLSTADIEAILEQNTRAQ
ncbi:hypothetical protein [Phenylobacterium deserti]|uniref:hypothetical protein n=1 Tax=Phenylobacterium deserti TaxID=1914756 RepID=UPI0014021C19|nr:hypothetical protein [Phenylobacterium deserti]